MFVIRDASLAVKISFITDGFSWHQQFHHHQMYVKIALFEILFAHMAIHAVMLVQHMFLLGDFALEGGCTKSLSQGSNNSLNSHSYMLC